MLFAYKKAIIARQQTNRTNHALNHPKPFIRSPTLHKQGVISPIYINLPRGEQNQAYI